MQAAVTISLVPQARGGPFVFWDDLPGACEKAARLGFDAVEIFASKPGSVSEENLRPLLERHGLKLAALGTGAGWVVHKLVLTHPDAAHRAKAVAFVRSLIEAGARFGAPVIVGSMQGRWGEGLPREVAMEYLRHSLNELGEHARGKGVPLLFEPLNRYETNLVNTLADGVALLRSLKTHNVKLLADLFHMNIEEADVAAALRETGADVGHVHLADSNRRPAGNGHTDFGAVAAALRSVGYRGFLSAECLPYPDPDAAAQATITSFKRFFT